MLDSGLFYRRHGEGRIERFNRLDWRGKPRGYRPFALSAMICQVGLIEKRMQMRLSTPLKWCALLAVLFAVSGQLWAQPIGFGVNSRGNFADSEDVNALWRINLTTGHYEKVGWTSYLDLEALTFDPDGTLFGADDESKTLVRVSQVTGLAIPVGGAGNRHNMNVSLQQSMDFGMTLDCEGNAWVVSDIQQSLFSADMETGRLTRIGEAGSLGAPITDIATIGDQTFGITTGGGTNGSAAESALYAVDLETATAELIGPLGSAASPYNNAGLAFDEEGVLWAITDRRAVSAGDFPSEILRIDPHTGQAEKVADTLVGVESLAIFPNASCQTLGEPVPIDPEPESDSVAVPLLSLPGLLVLMMLVLGLAWLQIRYQP